MKHFIIASHGELADAILDSVQLIMGSIKNISSISMNADTGMEEVRNSFQEIFIREQQAQDFIILTDVLGGSIATLSIEFIEPYNAHVITGFNLPMIIEMLSLQETMNSEQLVQHGINQGREGILYANQLIFQENTEE